jgi:AcrR family transcriptional regulator
MHTPIRILRDLVDSLPGQHPKLSARELDLQDRILDTAPVLMARYGGGSITVNSLAITMRLAPATIRRLFPDLDCILFELLSRHLRALSCALGQVPREHPNRQAAQRAAYVEYTRNGYAGTTDIQTLLLRERHTLPPNLADHIEHIRLQIPQIEAMIATLANPGVAPVKHKPLFSRQTQPVMPKAQKNKGACASGARRVSIVGKGLLF